MKKHRAILSSSRRSKTIKMYILCNGFNDLFSIKWRRSVSFHSAAIRRSLAELEELVNDSSIDDGLREEVYIDIEKLIYLRDYYEWLARLVDAFEDHDIFNLVPIKKPEQDTKNK